MENSDLSTRDYDTHPPCAVRWSELPRPSGDSLLRLKEVMSRTGISRSSIYAKMDKGEFPRSRRLGVRMVGWYESHIDAWIADPI